MSKQEKQPAGKKITLHPLKFEDAIKSLIEVKPNKKLVVKASKNKTS